MSEAAKLAEALRRCEACTTNDGVGRQAREALAAYEQAQAEPVGYVSEGAIKDMAGGQQHANIWRSRNEYNTVPLFAAPVAQAEPRKPLTHAQIDAIWNSVEWSPRLHVEIARAVEAACAEAWGVKLAGQGKGASK